MDSDKHSFPRVRMLADEDLLIANPTSKNLSRILEHINSVLRDPLCSLIPQTVDLVCKLIPVEERLPCAPFSIDKIMLSLAERSPHQLVRIMTVLEKRIPNARRSRCVEACEVVLSYSVLNNIWNKDCEERLWIVSEKFRKKIAKRRAMRSHLEEASARLSGLRLYEDIFDVVRFFTHEYFLGETCWNPVLPHSSAGIAVKPLDGHVGSGYSAVDMSKLKCRANRDREPCPQPCLECLLVKYTARIPIEMDEPSGTSFAQHFLFSYYLICTGEYRQAKDSLKTILLNLKEKEAQVARKISMCTRKPESTPFSVQGHCENEGQQNAKNTDMEKHIVAIKLHIYNLISFCHLYLGEYTELCYYLVRAINISNSDAFIQRKRLVDFITGASSIPSLDVWIGEINFIGGFYAKNFDAIRDFELTHYVCCYSKRALVRTDNRMFEKGCHPCSKSLDIFFQEILRDRSFLDRKLVLSILLRNERSILRELRHESSIKPSIFAEETTTTSGARRGVDEEDTLLCFASSEAGLRESALCMYLLSMIPPGTKVLSFYMIESTLFVNEYPSCRSTTVPQFDVFLDELAAILQRSKETLKQKVSTRKDAKDWWEKRYELDGRLGALIRGLSVDVDPAECNALLVDVQLHNFPFEVCDVFAGKRVFRIPSLSFLCSSSQDAAGRATSIAEHCIRRKKVKGCADALSACELSTEQCSTNVPSGTGTLPISIRSGSTSMFYLLDLLGNLEKSRLRLKPLLSCMPGVAGRLPNAEELRIAKSADTLLYFGHGNGSRYLKGCRNKHMGLFGCSSARTLWSPNFRLQGAIREYLENCLFLLGCLWDVTDHDLDEVAKCVLERGEVDRSVCRLRYLNGAAIVVYGNW